MDEKRFEEIIEKAIFRLPQEFKDGLENIEVTVEDFPGFKQPRKTILLGLYEGIPLDERTHYYAGVLPDKITLYRKNIEAICSTEEEMIEQIKTTLLHEIGHYFGITDKRLRELGY